MTDHARLVPTCGERENVVCGTNGIESRYGKKGAGGKGSTEKRKGNAIALLILRYRILRVPPAGKGDAEELVNAGEEKTGGSAYLRHQSFTHRKRKENKGSASSQLCGPECQRRWIWRKRKKSPSVWGAGGEEKKRKKAKNDTFRSVRIKQKGRTPSRKK